MHDAFNYKFSISHFFSIYKFILWEQFLPRLSIALVVIFGFGESKSTFLSFIKRLSIVFANLTTKSYNVVLELTKELKISLMLSLLWVVFIPTKKEYLLYTSIHDS